MLNKWQTIWKVFGEGRVGWSSVIDRVIPMNSDNKAYTITILWKAMEEYKAGRPVTMKCLRCGEILEVHYNPVTRTWVVKCPSKHFVYYAANSTVTPDKF